MTDSIAIPKRKGKQRLVTAPLDLDQSGTSESSPSSSTTSSSTSGSSMPISVSDKPLAAQEKGKTPIKLASSAYDTPHRHERRTSWLSSSISKSEHMTLNIGDDDRPRLITCVKASQGFDWNQDIFLPSYMSDRDHQAELERRQDPVEDIFISDEEAEMMFPQ